MGGLAETGLSPTGIPTGQDGPQRVLLVAYDFPGGRGQAGADEFVELAAATESEIAGLLRGKRQRPDPATFIGRGKLEEIAHQVADLEIDLVIFNHSLSPAQERNIEGIVCTRVLDRNGLILDIFARRARSFEGKLQVELAQLKHLSTRLVRGWSHLERQRGGVGLRGPGETQLETDRRLLGRRVRQIEKQIDAVRRSRALNRSQRNRAGVPVVALVGYTNAGKSTLFTALSGAPVLAADKLFATLDTTLRRLPLPGMPEAVVADTVGFVADLPHALVAAFRATLEEAVESDLLLLVADCADDSCAEQQAAVREVLTEIGAEDNRLLLVFNKADLRSDTPIGIERDEAAAIRSVWVSARDGQGLDALRDAIVETLAGQATAIPLELPATAGKLRARLHASGAVVDEIGLETGGWQMQLRMPAPVLEEMLSRHGLDLMH